MPVLPLAERVLHRGKNFPTSFELSAGPGGGGAGDSVCGGRGARSAILVQCHPLVLGRYRVLSSLTSIGRPAGHAVRGEPSLKRMRGPRDLRYCPTRYSYEVREFRNARGNF